MVALIEGSGRTREPGEIFRKPLKDADSLNDSGYVLKALEETSVQKVAIAAAADFPYAVNMRSSRDPFDLNHPSTVFLLGNNTRLATIDVCDDGEVALKVANNNAAIAVGDPLVVAAAGGGKVDKYTPTTVAVLADTVTRFIELGKIVGYAQEKIAAGGGGLPGADKVRTRITIKNLPVIA
jgi:hypothetical protein